MRILTRVILPIVIIALIILSSSLVVVKEWEKGLQLRFGRIVAIYDEPGVYFKMPLIDNVRIFDGRIQTLDTPPEPFLTSEKKNLIVDTFIKWRVIDPEVYYQKVSGNPGVFNRLFEPIVKNNFRAAFGKRDVQTVVGGTVALKTEDADKKENVIVVDKPSDALTLDENTLKKVQSEDVDIVIRSKENVVPVIAGQKIDLNNTVRQEIEKTILVALSVEAKEYGVEIIDVRINGVELPDDVTDNVFKRMRTERERVATELRSKGEAAYIEKVAEADSNRVVLLANAYEEAEKIRGEGDAGAATIYGEAYGQDPEFYSFYRSLEAYRNAFQNSGDLLILDPDSDFFKHFQQKQ